MKLAWMTFANHAESPPNGLLYLSGAAWDTINVGGPLPETLPQAQSGAVAVFQGAIVIRLLFHRTEAERTHEITLTVTDEDGGMIATAQAQLEVSVPPDQPVGWDIGANVVLPLTGLPLPRFGLYSASLQVNGQHIDDLPFRVVKRYE